MEKKNRPYRVVPYNPDWKERYEKEKKILKDIFQDKAQQIEHIGSTSVEGMWAKPQIDILIIVEDLSDADELIEEMEEKGYNYQSDFDQYNERYFTRDSSSGERKVSAHVMTQENPQSESHIYFRNYLREHPKVRERYSDVKRKAYKKGVDRAQYPEEKKEVVQEILQKAEKWYKEKKST